MTSSSSSAAPGGELLPATRRALTHRVAVGQAEGRTPSLAGAVVRDGGQAWFGARSMLEGHEPDGDTQYRIGSLTKTFIAVLVMRLRDEGRLDLADPLGKHLDAGVAATATIAQLLSHTAGLASETPGPWWERSPGELRPGLADILGASPHPAGRLFHYSNPGYGLLGALVSQLRGHGWAEALRREILQLAGDAAGQVLLGAPADIGVIGGGDLDKGGRDPSPPGSRLLITSRPLSSTARVKVCTSTACCSCVRACPRGWWHVSIDQDGQPCVSAVAGRASL